MIIDDPSQLQKKHLTEVGPTGLNSPRNLKSPDQHFTNSNPYCQVEVEGATTAMVQVLFFFGGLLVVCVCEHAFLGG